MSEKRQDHDDEQNEPYAAGWGIAPASAVGPPRQRAQECQDQNYDQDSSEHGLFLSSEFPSKFHIQGARSEVRISAPG
jgi:hypothetical protein